MKSRGIVQRIDRRVDLGDQPAAAVSDGLQPASLFLVSVCASAVLVGSHGGRVGHGVPVVGVWRQCLEDAVPSLVLTSTVMSQVQHPEIAKPL